MSIAYVNEFTSAPTSMSATTVLSCVNSILRVQSTSSDPYINMYSLGSFNPALYKYIAVKYRVSGNAGKIQIFFTNSRRTSANSDQMVESASLNNDGQWHTVNIYMGGHTYWNHSNITGWRFDWCTANSVTMDIDFIILATHSIPVTISQFTADTPAVYLTLPPDWKKPIQVSYHWQTGILTSIKGKEQRSAYRSQCLRSIAFELSNLSYEESHWLLSRINRYSNHPWVVPLWPEVIEVTSIASKTLTTDHNLFAKDLSVNQLIMILSTTDLFQYATTRIASIALHTLTLQDAVGGSLVPPVIAVPIMIGYINKDAMQYISASMHNYSIAFQETMTGITENMN